MEIHPRGSQLLGAWFSRSPPLRTLPSVSQPCGALPSMCQPYSTLSSGSQPRSALLSGCHLHSALPSGSQLRDALLPGSQLRSAMPLGCKPHRALPSGAQPRDALLQGVSFAVPCLREPAFMERPRSICHPYFMERPHTIYHPYFRSIHHLATLQSLEQLLLWKKKACLKSYGDRAFSVAALSLWNSLTISIRNCDTVHAFKQARPKTFLFKQAYDV